MQVQNGHVDRIEQSVAILSPNQVCPRLGPRSVLAMPIHLEFTQMLILPPPPASHVLSIYPTT